METRVPDLSIKVPASIEPERLTVIRSKLQKNDVTRIAELAGVTRVWASYVLHGRGTSEPLLQVAEEYIRDQYQD